MCKLKDNWRIQTSARPVCTILCEIHRPVASSGDFDG